MGRTLSSYSQSPSGRSGFAKVTLLAPGVCETVACDVDIPATQNLGRGITVPHLAVRPTMCAAVMLLETR